MTVSDTYKRKLATSLKKLQEQAQAWYEKKEEVWGLPTGLDTLDELTGGFQAEELITIAGGTGKGKTAFLCQVMEESAPLLTAPQMHIFFSTEMSGRSLLLRNGSRRAMLDSRLVRKGQISAQDKARFDREIERLAQLPILIVDDPSMTSLDILNTVNFLVEEGIRPAIVGVDYIQHLNDDGMPSHTAITGAMRRLAQIRNDYSCSVVVLSQYARSYAVNQNGPVEVEPQLWHLKESGSIENDSEQVWMLHTPTNQEQYEWEGPTAKSCKLFIRKNRNGPLGQVGLWFVESLTQFATNRGMIHLESEFGT